MIVFVDTDSPRTSLARNRTAVRRRLEAVLADLGAYVEIAQVVLSSQSAAGYPLDELRAGQSDIGALRIEGVLWDDVPPVPLARYDHILYWLTRRHVWRLPTWLAVQATRDGWPSGREDRLVLADVARDPAAAALSLRGRLEDFCRRDVWWGEGPPPDAALLRRAHALMVAWSVARSRWPVVLGTTALEVEQRLGPLLTIHAGAQHRIRVGEWFPHWVHLPREELQKQRPIELMETQGLMGIDRVLEHVWTSGSA